VDALGTPKRYNIPGNTLKKGLLMHGRRFLILSLCPLAIAPALADTAPAPAPSATLPGVAVPNPANSNHPYDPCAMASKSDIASATGVAVDEVYTPKQATKSECIWTVGNKFHQPGQQVAMTMQTVDDVKASHGMARFGVLLNAVQNVPGVKMPTNPIVTDAFKDAAVVQGLGDQAGWKNGTLSVLKAHLLFQISVTGQNDAPSKELDASKSIMTDVISHIDTTKQ